MKKALVSVLIAGGAIFGTAATAGASYPPVPVPPSEEPPGPIGVAAPPVVAAAPPVVSGSPAALPATGASGVETGLVLASGLLVGGAALAMVAQRRRRLTAV